MEYMSSGLANSAATSRKMWMLSASSRARCVSRADAGVLRRGAGTGFRVVTGCTWACIETFTASVKSRPTGPAYQVAGDCTDAKPRSGKHFWLCSNNSGVTGRCRQVYFRFKALRSSAAVIPRT